MKSNLFDDRMIIRIPHSLSETLKEASSKKMVKVSEYVRQSIRTALRKDGIEIGS